MQNCMNDQISLGIPLNKAKKQTAKGKRARRLIILVVAILTLCTTAGGFYAYRQRQIHARFLKARQDGMSALRAGDNDTAVADLALYLQRYPNDVDALADFAHARLLTSASNGQNIGDAIVALRNLLKIQPQRLAERRTLLEPVPERRDTSQEALNPTRIFVIS